MCTCAVVNTLSGVAMFLKNRHLLFISTAGSTLALLPGLFYSVSATTLTPGQDWYLDFETDASGNALVAGTGEFIDNQWAAWGLNLSVDSYRRDADDILLLYDSSTTGKDDDLRTGPYIGSPTENNLLIIHEDTSRNSIFNPDDEEKGGAITFDFSGPLTAGNSAYSATYRGVDLGTIRLVDIDDNPTLNGVSFRAFSGDQLLFSKTAQELNHEGLASEVFAGINRKGDNSVWDFNLGSFQRNVDTSELEVAVTRLVVDYDGSGAIAGLGWQQLNAPETDTRDIPEPASVLGLVTLGLCATGSALARRQQQ